MNTLLRRCRPVLPLVQRSMRGAVVIMALLVASAAAAQLAPPQNLVPNNVTISWYANALAIDWDPVPGADYYGLQIVDETDHGTDPQYTPECLSEGNYCNFHLSGPGARLPNFLRAGHAYSWWATSDAFGEGEGVACASFSVDTGQ